MGAGTQVAGQVRGPSGEEGRQGRGLLCHRHDNAILSFPDPPNRLYMPAGQHRSGLPDHPCAMLVLTMPLTMPLVMPLTMPLTMPLNVPLTMPLPHHPESLSVNLPAPAPPPPPEERIANMDSPVGMGGYMPSSRARTPSPLAGDRSALAATSTAAAAGAWLVVRPGWAYST